MLEAEEVIQAGVTESRAREVLEALNLAADALAKYGPTEFVAVSCVFIKMWTFVVDILALELELALTLCSLCVLTERFLTQQWRGATRRMLLQLSGLWWRTGTVTFGAFTIRCGP